jgi:hypothetical protein
MPTTYEPIATQILGATAATVTFSSIPQTYTDLILIANPKIESGAINLQCRFNSDTGSNYSFTNLSGDGSQVVSQRYSNVTVAELGAYGYIDTTFGCTTMTHFMNYSNTSMNKPIISRGSNANNGMSLVVNLWRNTAAITSITFITGTFSVGSTFTLYGIKAA